MSSMRGVGDLDLTYLVDALRDMAAKATETKELTVAPEKYGIMGVKEHYVETVDKYDRQWLAGRLLGIADTIDMLAPPDKTQSHQRGTTTT